MGISVRPLRRWRWCRGLIYASLYWFPLVNGIDSPYFYQLAGVGFVATIATRWHLSDGI